MLDYDQQPHRTPMGLEVLKFLANAMTFVGVAIFGIFFWVAILAPSTGLIAMGLGVVLMVVGLSTWYATDRSVAERHRQHSQRLRAEGRP